MNNVTLTLLGGLTPLLIGFIWYSDKPLGKAWHKEHDHDSENVGE